jgi:imidazolonepropionase-like amidohydrolase
MRNYLAAALFSIVLLAGCGGSAPSGTAITNVTVIDAINGVREHQTVIFDGDEIVAIESGATESAVVESIDGSGKYLIPGLWDFHVHLAYDDRFTEAMPELFLSYGITSVRDTGGLMHKILPVVEKMRAADALAPRVFFSGPLLDGNFVVYDGVSRPEVGTRNATPDDAKAMIAGLKSQGVDFIKIYELVTADVFAAMVEAANEHELPIDSHVPLSMRASTAGPNVDSIEHLRNIEMDCASNAPELHETRLAALKNPDNLSGYELRASLHSLQRIPAIGNYDEARCDRTIAALKSTMQVPTLRLNGLSLVQPYSRDDWVDALSGIPEEAREDWSAQSKERPFEPKDTNDDFLKFAEWSIFLVNRMHNQGVPIAAGTDTPIGLSVPGYSLHSELEMLVRAGLSPLEAIGAATVKPAEYFSLQDEMGTIDVGKKADLVLLDADPLVDISNSKRISAVVSQGRLIRPE